MMTAAQARLQTVSRQAYVQDKVQGILNTIEIYIRSQNEKGFQTLTVDNKYAVDVTGALSDALLGYGYAVSLTADKIVISWK